MFEMLNAEQIAARRVPLHEAELSEVKSKNWHCHYCNRKLASENVFMKHHCEPKRRTQELMSSVGQAALGFYQSWMKQRKYTPPGAAAFMESKLYRSFINFAQMVQNTNMPHPDKYISLMLAGSIQPPLWCRDEVYSIYLEWLDKQADPIDQAISTMNYIFDLREKEEVELKDIFTHLGPQGIIGLVRQRRLSPWFIFCSSSFNNYLRTWDKAHLNTLDSIVKFNFWAEKFKINQPTIDKIKEIAKEVGL